MKPVCTFCCKMRCLLAVLLLTAGMLMLSAQSYAAGAENTGLATEREMTESMPAASDSVNSHYLVQLVGGLMVVLLSIVVLAWFAKRFTRLQRSSDGVLEVIGGISMGARERVVLLRVGEQRLLLGVSPGRISTLHVVGANAAAHRLIDSVTDTSFANHLHDAVRASTGHDDSNGGHAVKKEDT